LRQEVNDLKQDKENLSKRVNGLERARAGDASEIAGLKHKVVDLNKVGCKVVHLYIPSSRLFPKPEQTLTSIQANKDLSA